MMFVFMKIRWILFCHIATYVADCTTIITFQLKYKLHILDAMKIFLDSYATLYFSAILGFSSYYVLSSIFHANVEQYVSSGISVYIHNIDMCQSSNQSALCRHIVATILEVFL